MGLTNFEKLKNLSMEEMAEFLSDQMALEGTVYDQWMTDTFCNNCPEVEGYNGSSASFCEMNEDCPYGLWNISDKDLVMRWLSWVEEKDD